MYTNTEHIKMCCKCAHIYWITHTTQKKNLCIR